MNKKPSIYQILFILIFFVWFPIAFFFAGGDFLSLGGYFFIPIVSIICIFVICYLAATEL